MSCEGPKLSSRRLRERYRPGGREGGPTTKAGLFVGPTGNARRPQKPTTEFEASFSAEPRFFDFLRTPEGEMNMESAALPYIEQDPGGRLEASWFRGKFVKELGDLGVLLR